MSRRRSVASTTRLPRRRPLLRPHHAREGLGVEVLLDVEGQGVIHRDRPAERRPLRLLGLGQGADHLRELRRSRTPAERSPSSSAAKRRIGADAGRRALRGRAAGRPATGIGTQQPARMPQHVADRRPSAPSPTLITRPAARGARAGGHGGRHRVVHVGEVLRGAVVLLHERAAAAAALRCRSGMRLARAIARLPRAVDREVSERDGLELVPRVERPAVRLAASLDAAKRLSRPRAAHPRRPARRRARRTRRRRRRARPATPPR